MFFALEQLTSHGPCEAQPAVDERRHRHVHDEHRPIEGPPPHAHRPGRLRRRRRHGRLQAPRQQTSGGAYSDITGAAITQITAGSKVFTIEVRDDQLQSIVGNGYQFVQVSLTIGTNAVLVAAIVLGGEAEAKPAKAQDIAAAVQRVVT